MESRGNSGTCGIKYDDVYVGRVDDWRLTFDIWTMSPVEPVMGSMEHSPGSYMYGVVYHITSQREWEKLLRSEGIGSTSTPIYQLFTVNAICYKPNDSAAQSPAVTNDFCSGDEIEGGVKHVVHSLKTNEGARRPNWREMYTFPSARYMSLLLSGARRESLPPSYITYLESIPTARPWNVNALKFVALGSTMQWWIRLNLGSQYLWPLTVCSRICYSTHEKNLSVHPKRTLVNDVMVWLSFMAFLSVVSFHAFPAILLICISKKWRGIFFRSLQRATASQPSKTALTPREVVLQKDFQKED